MIKVDGTVYHGRPENETGRLEKEIRVYDALDSLGIEYLRIDHEAAMTMDDCEEARRILGVGVCKNLFLTNRQETKYYLLLMPARKRFLTKEFSRQIGSSRLSFGKEEMMRKLLDLTPGSASITGLINDTKNQVTLAIDRDVYEAEKFACHPSINTSSIMMNSRDMWEIFLPAIRHTPVIVDLVGEG